MADCRYQQGDELPMLLVFENVVDISSICCKGVL
jgi:hypothetical protein